jgi:hypothetical protein
LLVADLLVIRAKSDKSPARPAAKESDREGAKGGRVEERRGDV